MKSVTVTVVIPTYMEEKYINECMKSILLQTYPKENMEIFFVDGNSNDKTFFLAVPVPHILDLYLLLHPTALLHPYI